MYTILTPSKPSESRGIHLSLLMSRAALEQTYHMFERGTGGRNPGGGGSHYRGQSLYHVYTRKRGVSHHYLPMLFFNPGVDNKNNTCSPEEFECENRYTYDGAKPTKCLPKHWVCDRYDDYCKDFADESPQYCTSKSIRYHDVQPYYRVNKKMIHS